MTTQVLELTDESLKKAAEIIREGGLVGIPTETVYGLGADALNEAAVRSIFAAKGRPADNPLIVHICDLTQIKELITGEMPENAVKLANAFWPGPMTMIFPKAEVVPMVTTGGLDTVAVRFPSHPAAQKLIRWSGKMIAAPSGNRSGRPSPTCAWHMLEDMDGIIPLILDGGVCDVGVESTVIDVTCDPVRVLRPGGITPEMIRDVLGSVAVDESLMRPLKTDEKPRSPGMKYRHYAPKGNVTIVRGSAENVQKKIIELYDADDRKKAVLALEGHIAAYGDRRVISLGADARGMAHTLFDALRRADEEGIEVMYSEAVAADGIGLAVMNRLGRAAAFNVIEV